MGLFDLPRPSHRRAAARSSRRRRRAAASLGILGAVLGGGDDAGGGGGGGCSATSAPSSAATTTRRRRRRRLLGNLGGIFGGGDDAAAKAAAALLGNLGGLFGGERRRGGEGGGWPVRRDRGTRNAGIAGVIDLLPDSVLHLQDVAGRIVPRRVGDVTRELGGHRNELLAARRGRPTLVDGLEGLQELGLPDTVNLGGSVEAGLEGGRHA